MTRPLLALLCWSCRIARVDTHCLHRGNPFTKSSHQAVLVTSTVSSDITKAALQIATLNGSFARSVWVHTWCSEQLL